MKIFQEEAGVLSEQPCWVCLCDEYMYTADTLEELIVILNTEWMHEKHNLG